MNIERPTSSFEFEKMKQKFGFLFSFDIGRSMFDVGRSFLKIISVKILYSDPCILSRTHYRIARYL